MVNVKFLPKSQFNTASLFTATVIRNTDHESKFINIFHIKFLSFSFWLHSTCPFYVWRVIVAPDYTQRSEPHSGRLLWTRYRPAIETFTW